jgi:hypothetical protein
MELIKFLKDKFGLGVSHAIKESLKRYGKICGYDVNRVSDLDKTDKIDGIISEYRQDINNIATSLANGDVFLYEELRSEMYIYVLGCAKGDKIINLMHARRKAVEYLSKKFSKENQCTEERMSEVQ